MILKNVPDNDRIEKKIRINNIKNKTNNAIVILNNDKNINSSKKISNFFNLFSFINSFVLHIVPVPFLAKSQYTWNWTNNTNTAFSRP